MMIYCNGYKSVFLLFFDGHFHFDIQKIINGEKIKRARVRDGAIVQVFETCAIEVSVPIWNPLFSTW